MLFSLHALFPALFPLAPAHRYAGAVGGLHFDGSMDTGLTLRTIRIKNGVASVRAGKEGPKSSASPHLKLKSDVDALTSHSVHASCLLTYPPTYPPTVLFSMLTTHPVINPSHTHTCQERLCCGTLTPTRRRERRGSRLRRFSTLCQQRHPRPPLFPHPQGHPHVPRGTVGVMLKMSRFGCLSLTTRIRLCTPWPTT
jgi:hypothetical protein